MIEKRSYKFELPSRYPFVEDQNGNVLCRRVRREGDLWGANVWTFGGFGGYAINLRRYYYKTRAEARSADAADAFGPKANAIKTGKYAWE